jgi:cation diffusion facilitator family transporter
MLWYMKEGGLLLTARLTDWLLATFVPQHGDINDPLVRAKYGFLEAWISITGNVGLAAVKIVLGVTLNSVSLMADAAHTISDVLTSGVVLASFYISAQEPDREHPFGHGRVEFMASLAIAVLLGLIGIEFGRTSSQRLLDGSQVTGSMVAALIMFLSGLAKELMALVSIDLGHRIDSSALLADAWHHRSDAIASVLVAVAIVAAYLGYPSLDAVLGLGVSALIVYTAWQLGSSATNSLIGEAPDANLVEQIITTANSVPGVLKAHDLIVHEYGITKAVSLRIVVDGNISLTAAHKIAHQVETKIRTVIVGTAVVHVDPNGLHKTKT